MTFESPLALLLLLIFPAVWFWRRGVRGGFRFSRGDVAARSGRRVSRWLGALPSTLRGLALVALIVALARPQTGVATEEIDAEGIAIALVVDISSSMLALDMQPLDRLEVAKRTVLEFVRNREYDRIALIAFAGEAMTQVPLTIDYRVLEGAINDLEVDLLEDGTAIGTALATAANRLRRAPGESRVAILLTDGENNQGEVDPVTAARAAAAYGIRTYTVGVGSEGVAPVPIGRGPLGTEYANMRVRLDEDLLRRIAAITGGQYFRATNARALEEIYRHIDELEKTPVNVRRYIEFSDHFRPFVLLACLFVLAEWMLRARRYPLYV
ncbi:MAG: VWA domain-containing protein [Gemmatimonadetes bacterium]|uniref:VWA domain-containing protein n=1 Tax=Candidatus Kutchimonas denitrificans TaxID=3056748 RepID=A0AAE4ZB92_9BACT|nr:VWA domain-containing protein [Gemmatimonadota bacterium]NIR76012.1 VWA domain-containing protein [Candidatus Kutchimonas denitrificans]NIS02204.1 VWA domain-containing protein [Gemmatimonadota bacterium]NIT68030.1 VWA domain-containing protein [Gemmatimonadota bacterium]NIU54056.1 VWA domain-containing protein [Gemmatimonadota bacterium]